METIEISAFSSVIARTVREYVDKSQAENSRKIDELIAAIKSLPNPEREVREAIDRLNSRYEAELKEIRESIRAIPAGPKGDPGERGEAGTIGPSGKDGAIGPPGLNGTNGTNGKDGTNGIDGKDGINGRDGRDGQSIVGPKGDKGDTGNEGKIGPEGKPGKDGIGLPGRDGEIVQIEAFQSEDDPCVITFRTFLSENRTRDFAFRFPIPHFRGVYRAGEEYKRGMQVTHQGSQWACMVDATSSSPSKSDDWVLVTKRGADGKDGKGIKGDKGDPGQDLRYK